MMRVYCIVMDLLKALLVTVSVNTFQCATMEAVSVSVDKGYSSLLGSSYHADGLAR
jgi:hypothetical protein